MKYNFNERIDRSENHSAKWAEMERMYNFDREVKMIKKMYDF